MSKKDAKDAKAVRADKADKAAKGKKGKKGKDREAEGEPADEGVVRVGAHPRARRSVRRTRAGAGMGGFAMVWLLAVLAGVPQFEAILRALAAGIVLHFVAWAFAIALWRRLLVAEIEATHERIRAAAQPPAF